MYFSSNTHKRRILTIIASLLILPFLFSCAGVDPRNVQVELQEGAPEVKVTSFTRALSDLGMATRIYGKKRLNIQSKAIHDDTGAAEYTLAEIPVEITEMIKSGLNSVGGQVYFIPFNPSFMLMQFKTGYSNFDNKVVPDIIITGAITEFDRGLETSGRNTDFDVETKPFTNAPKWLPDNKIGVDAAKFEKSALSRITIDFNLIDFQTMTGVQKMQAVNTVIVHKAVAEKELAFSLFGPTLGLKGTIKKVQGRHAAIRLLVQISLIQMIGKYLTIPYWNLTSAAGPDQVVLENIKLEFLSMSKNQRILKIQELLYLHGFDDVYMTGLMDDATMAALEAVDPARISRPGKSVGVDAYIKVYTSVPITDNALERRLRLASRPKRPPEEPEKSGFLSLDSTHVYLSSGVGEMNEITNGSVLSSGAPYKVLFKADEDCHLYIVQADSSGEVFQLFPMGDMNGVALNNFNPVRKGRTYTLPSEDISFFLDKKVGVERIYLIAARERNSEVENLFIQLDADGVAADSNRVQMSAPHRLTQQKDVDGTQTDRPLDAAMRESGEIFTLIGEKLERFCDDCVYILEFYHQ